MYRLRWKVVLPTHEQILQNEVVSHEDGFPVLEAGFGMIESVQGGVSLEKWVGEISNPSLSHRLF